MSTYQEELGRYYHQVGRALAALDSLKKSNILANRNRHYLAEDEKKSALESGTTDSDEFKKKRFLVDYFHKNAEIKMLEYENEKNLADNMRPPGARDRFSELLNSKIRMNP
jgi:hypothetical protein